MTETTPQHPRASTANLRRTEARERSEHLTVRGYHVELDLSAARERDQPTFASTTTIRFDATTPSTFVDFIAPAVHSVELNGRALDPDACFDGNRVRLEGLAASNTVTIAGDAAYSRTGEGLHRFVDPVDGETYLYTQYEPADARRVFANFEQPDLKAPFTFVVTAPTGWQVLSNAAADAVVEDGSATTTRFTPTLPISTYVTAVIAGPYHRAEDRWSGTFGDGSALEVPLGAYCRRSLAEHFDAERIFEVTKQGLDFFHDAFDYPYPWGKYDQVFVPEYNLGAMENPGCVTFTEHYVFRGAATRSQYQARANTILHEMAHMWFGDLVTMRWWDDLWLKESFADYMGAHASAAATEFTDAWTSFASRRKAWAYLQDQLPTTHPVVATIDDLEAAKQNFDGITYAKGASALKQLVAYVGQQEFFAGARAYFRAHEFGNTTLPDLLGELETASGRDLQEWSRLWLQTAGVSTLVPTIELAPGGTVSRLEVAQDAQDRTTGERVVRPHRLALGVYELLEGRLTRTRRIELDLLDAVTPVPEAVGLGQPALLLLNDDDLTYAKVRLDARSLASVREHLSTIEASLSRAVVWSALWNATRDGDLPAAAFVDTVLGQAPGEPDVGTLRDVVSDAQVALERYLPAAERPAARERLLSTAWQRLDASPPGSDTQLVWARTAASVAATVPSSAGRVRALLDGSAPVEGLAMDPDLRWSLWQALAATGSATAEELDAEQGRDGTASGATHRLEAWAGLPDAGVKAEAWRALVDADELTNEHVGAAIAGFGQPLHAELTAPYADRYFAELRRLWSERSIEIAGRLVRGLYPGRQDLVPGQRPEEQPVLQQSRRWLAENADAPAALRRLVIEQQDHLERALRAQAAAAGAGSGGAAGAGGGAGGGVGAGA